MERSATQLRTLVTVLSQFPEIPGNKALQKLIYLGQMITGITIWEYKWFHFGPYSSQLQSTITQAQNMGILRIENGKTSYSLKLDYQKAKQLETMELPIESVELLEGIETIVKKTKDSLSDPKKLELVASLAYLFNESNDIELASKELALRKNRYKYEEIKKFQPLLVELSASFKQLNASSWNYDPR